jgi:hypothetical protein
MVAPQSDRTAWSISPPRLSLGRGGFLLRNSIVGCQPPRRRRGVDRDHLPPLKNARSAVAGRRWSAFSSPDGALGAPTSSRVLRIPCAFLFAGERGVRIAFERGDRRFPLGAGPAVGALQYTVPMERQSLAADDAEAGRPADPGQGSRSGCCA